MANVTSTCPLSLRIDDLDSVPAARCIRNDVLEVGGLILGAAASADPFVVCGQLLAAMRRLVTMLGETDRPLLSFHEHEQLCLIARKAQPHATKVLAGKMKPEEISDVFDTIQESIQQLAVPEPTDHAATEHCDDLLWMAKASISDLAKVATQVWHSRLRTLVAGRYTTPPTDRDPVGSPRRRA